MSFLGLDNTFDSTYDIEERGEKKKESTYDIEERGEKKKHNITISDESDESDESDNDELQETMDHSHLGGGGGGFFLSEKKIGILVKQAVDPLVAQINQLKEQVDALELKVDQNKNGIDQNKNVQKPVEAKGTNPSTSALSFSREDPLTDKGMYALKLLCIRNLGINLRQKEKKKTSDAEKAEQKLLDRFVARAREENWLNDSAHAFSVIQQKFRSTRHYLKKKLRSVVLEDISMSTPDRALQMQKTIRFLWSTLGVSEIPEEIKALVFNYVFILLKYLNAYYPSNTFSALEKEAKKKAVDNVWLYVNERVKNDQTAQPPRDADFSRERAIRLLKGGLEFKPL